jgi:rsbT co-antagonist protein RsbR
VNDAGARGEGEEKGAALGSGTSVIEGRRMSLTPELEVLRAERARSEERLADLLGVILAVASLDYSARAHVDHSGDLLDALATGLNVMVEELQASTAFVDNILAVMADALIVISADGTVKKANAAASRMLGLAEAVGMSAGPLFGGAAAGLSVEALADVFAGSGGEAEIITARGDRVPVSLSAAAMRGSGGHLEAVVCVARDISERKRVEAERARLEEILRRQTQAMLEMSTPLVPVGEGIVAMPLVGAIDPRRAQQVLQELLRGIVAHRASVAILDVTGVSGVDTEVAGAVLRAVQAARLIGARVVLTGIRPEVARTLTSLDIDLGGVVTRATLKSGVAFAQALLQREGSGGPLR